MTGIVAAEVGAWGLRLYFHDGNSFRTEDMPFSPFVLLNSEAATPENCTVEPLSGNGFFCRMAVFDSLNDYESQLAALKKSPGVMNFSSLLQQALGINDLRLFAGMDFSMLRCCCFTISSDHGSITLIQVADSAGNRLDFSGDEPEIIRNFNDYIKDYDPDVLCGFNCCRETLPLLTKRAGKYKIPLDCGRNGDSFAVKNSRYSAGEKQYSYQKYSLQGRHLVDLLHVIQLYDAAHRDIEEHTLEVIGEYFHIPTADPASMLMELAGILLPAYFYRTRELPLGFQECILRGSGSALDALLTAGYLRRKISLPLPENPRTYAGALSSMEIAGVFHKVRHCDVRSLYPSLLLTMQISPARDEAGIFLELLNKLRRFRLQAKDRAKSLPDGAEKRKFEALQSSFKILINSFYGYLGFAQGTFNDFDLAEKITAAGRELLGKLSATMQNHQAAVIEMDTDGIYFQMPQDVSRQQLDAALNEVLPPGIELEFDAEYPAMYSFKAKNYALLHSDGTITLTGAALKSRALEPFQRKFIMQIVSAKLHDDPDAAVEAYEFWKKSIADRSVKLEDLAKSEVLSDSPENYKRKLASGSGRRSAPYELALASGQKFRAGDKVKFYVTGEKAKVPVVGNSCLLADAPDKCRNENTAYYLAKLEALAQNFGIIR